jgi:catechol 2,3-dioxygenase-like lactoylglutathione lyase family enzyme
LERSIEFYKKALNLKVMRRKIAEDNSFELVFLGDSTTEHLLELTWLRDRSNPYDMTLGTTKFIWHLKPMIWMAHTSCTAKWVAFATKIKKWASISSVIRMDTGWK